MMMFFRVLLHWQCMIAGTMSLTKNVLCGHLRSYNQHLLGLDPLGTHKIRLGSQFLQVGDVVFYLRVVKTIFYERVSKILFLTGAKNCEISRSKANWKKPRDRYLH